MTEEKEEALREAACVGDLDSVDKLLALGVDVNSKNKVNGWTPLHWASKRGHHTVVKRLLDHGADESATNTNNETPADLTTNNAVRQLLGVPLVENKASKPAENHSFTPNYLANPEFIYSNSKHVDTSKEIAPQHPEEQDRILSNLHIHDGFFFQPQSVTCTKATQWAPAGLVIHPDTLVVCVRLASISQKEKDFVELEIDRRNTPTLEELTEMCCGVVEIGIKPEHVLKIRKLPRTCLKTNNDVRRLTDYQTLEIVLKPDALHPIDGTLKSSESLMSNRAETKYMKNQVAKLVF